LVTGAIEPMARILHEGEWYEQVSSEAFYEDEFERILCENATHLFPSHHLVPFKLLVHSDDGSAKPDFALIDKSYREWWIVEAEMSHHSFASHVEPQVSTLSKASYGESAAHYLHQRDSRLDLNRMLSMVKGLPPNVVVIVNAPVATWSRDLRVHRAVVTVLEIFRSRRNKHLYRLNGDSLPDRSTISSQCVVELSRFLRVLSPGILSVAHGETVPISFRGGICPWSRTDLADRVYLSCAKPVSLNPRAQYELVQKEDLTLTLSEYK